MHETEFHRLIALAVFVGTYVGLGIGRLPPFRVDRTGVAIIGAAVMVVTGVIPWDAAVAAVDAHTLVLLFGMMIVAAYLRLSGFFRLVTELAVRRARTPVGLLGMIIVAAGGLSALFVGHGLHARRKPHHPRLGREPDRRRGGPRRRHRDHLPRVLHGRRSGCAGHAARGLADPDLGARLRDERGEEPRWGSLGEHLRIGGMVALALVDR